MTQFRPLPPRTRITGRFRESRSNLRDRMLVALSQKDAILAVVEAAHGAAGWSSSAANSSRTEVKQGLELIEAERSRLEARFVAMKERLASGGEIGRAAAEAECERLLCRLGELADHRDHLTNVSGRIRPEIEVESVEWQKPLVLQDGGVAGFVDLWATVRVTAYRVAQGNDPWDRESRMRYEGCSVHHLIRSVALFVEPTVGSLAELVRRVRFVQAHAKNALPVLVTGAPVATEILAAQGIPTYLWSPESGPVAVQAALPPGRRARRVAPARGRVVPRVARPQLPSPRPSLPPASRTG